MAMQRLASNETASCNRGVHGSQRVLAPQPCERAELAGRTGLVGCRGSDAVDVLGELGGVPGFACAVTCGFAIRLGCFRPDFALADFGFGGHTKHSAAIP